MIFFESRYPLFRAPASRGRVPVGAPPVDPATVPVKVTGWLNVLGLSDDCHARAAHYMEPLAHSVGLNGYYADLDYNRKQGGAVKAILNTAACSLRCQLQLRSAAGCGFGSLKRNKTE